MNLNNWNFSCGCIIYLLCIGFCFLFFVCSVFFSVFTWEDIPLKEGLEYICCSFLQTEKKISWIQHFVFKIVTAYRHYFQLHQTYLFDRLLFKQYERQPAWYILKRWMHQTCCEIIREFKFMVEIWSKLVTRVSRALSVS